MNFVTNDGGRAAAGYKGQAGDCVARAIAIAAQMPYATVYERLAEGNASQRASKHTPKRARSARDGINTDRKWFKDYMKSLGFRWVPTMLIGQGCKMHLNDGELPAGRLVVAVSKHFTAVINGDIHDMHDPRREINVIEPDRGQELKSGQRRLPDNGGLASVQRRLRLWLLD